MNAAPRSDRDLDRSEHVDSQRLLGALQNAVENIERRIAEGFEDAKKHRCVVRAELRSISVKVDPLIQDVETLKLQHAALQADLAIILAAKTQLLVLRNAGKTAWKWLLIIAAAIAIFWSDQIKTPLWELLSLLRLG